MNQKTARPSRSFRRRATAALATAVGWFAVGLLSVIRLLPRRCVAANFGWLLRSIGRLRPEHRTGLANLAAAFPQKSAAEIDAILAGAWDNLGRIAAEFAHIDRLTSHDPSLPDDDIVADAATAERLHRLQRDGKPALIFAAHLANWELPALVAARHGLDTAVLYRRPNLPVINDAIVNVRSNIMGTLVPSGLDAPVRLLRTLQAGGHVGVLIDQNAAKGVEVTFFGRSCRVNPLIAQLARHIDCPIHGARMIRKSDRNRFQVELTEAVEPRRDAQGLVDVPGTMQVLMSVVEGWVREHPEQWLWQHRLWR